MRRAYRIFLERKTPGVTTPWRIAFDDGTFVDVAGWAIVGACRSAYDETQPKPYSVSGIGVVDVQADQAYIFESKIPLAVTNAKD